MLHTYEIHAPGATKYNGNRHPYIYVQCDPEELYTRILQLRARYPHYFRTPVERAPVVKRQRCAANM